MQLRCPFCGDRDVDEFLCLGSAPEAGAGAFESVYIRVSRPEISREYWEHSHGCGSWLEVTRNPSTNQVISIDYLDDAVAKETL